MPDPASRYCPECQSATCGGACLIDEMQEVSLVSRFWSTVNLIRMAASLATIVLMILIMRAILVESDKMTVNRPKPPSQQAR